jgi:CP family cyanate transporter-like MFS transporter
VSAKSPPVPGGVRAVVASRPARPVLLIAGLMLLAANLRPTITAVGPVLTDIREATGMSAAAAGLLTSLPLLAFAGISPFAPLVAKRFGVERALLGSIVLLGAGTLLRSAGPAGAIFAGTAVLGSAIAIGNVLLPGLVKQDFPNRAGLLTALYSTTMSGMAGVASGISVGLAHGAGFGWRGALAVWTALAVVSAAAWAPYAFRVNHVPRNAGAAPVLAARLRSSRLAWQVTLFWGLQSAIFYSLITWLATILEDDGASAATAGWVVGIMQLAGLVTTIGVPILADRRPSQRGLVVAVSALTLVGLAGLGTIGADAPLLWVIPLGLGTGGFFGLALIVLVLRASDSERAGALSGMAQSVGYLICAAGPIGLGALHDATGGWDASVVALVLICAGALVFGLGAARDARV